ncbi:hypothetical protein [Alkalihalobacillus sp. LMS39]|nr:hypothetical protein [Alkalihalobacillus sp. LMS39]UOE92152.1 hypothetical protein MM271_12855 [Alkalihalobacillus sp. LMS39]
MKKVVDLMKWPRTVPQPTMDEVLKRKKEEREKKINETMRKVNEIRRRS